jgi:poly[(R)-3-hydroxyalkanoate] polymerase subunit PhaC
MTAAPQYQGTRADALEIAGRLAAMGPHFAATLSEWVIRQTRAVNGLDYSLIDYWGVASAATRLGLEWWLEPQRALAALTELWSRNLSLLAYDSSGSNVAEGNVSGDKRFQDKAWSEDLTLRLVRDAYLINSRWLLAQVRAARTLDGHDRHKLEFYMRQLLSALSPSHWLTINPRVRARTLETCGGNLIEGLERLVQDLEKGKGLVPISQHDTDAFEVGRNLAITPGKVVFRNTLIELIQFAPTTSTVFRTPLLVVPPWINKYYVLDLQPENSLLRWAVGQGRTTFVISWVNPGAAHAGTGIDDYLRAGPVAAIEVVQRITRERKIDLLGFCIGGMLTLCTLAWLAAEKDRPIRSATLLATMVDLSEIGDSAVFIDERQLAEIERHTRTTGFLDGYHMKDMFSLLRENDLIWNYVVSSYLLGRPPPAFDMLHWNADSTRLPARMLSDFLRHIYMENSLVKRGRLRLAGRPIDLGRVVTPCYFLSTTDDHIAPWRACYAGTRHIGGPVEFVLGGSGHIAGIINPPTRSKYGYRTSPRTPANADEWLAEARQYEGSWWPYWAQWLAALEDEQVEPRSVGSKQYPPLMDAPGSYVLAA